MWLTPVLSLIWLTPLSRCKSQLCRTATPDTETSGIYQVNQSGKAGVWQLQQADNILDPTYTSDINVEKEHTLTIDVQDTPGVLNQVRVWGGGGREGEGWRGGERGRRCPRNGHCLHRVCRDMHPGLHKGCAPQKP